MILRNRRYTPQPPDRDAKSIYIFCEGVKREKQYFNYFKEIDSRINIVVYDLKETEDNSPFGLYDIAVASIQTETNPNGRYELIEGDEVWIVLDTDKDKMNSRKPQIEKIKSDCYQKRWSLSQSNPCFEVWLFYHFYSQKPEFNEIDTCYQWKQYLQKEKGGFDSKKHSILIQSAILNAQNSFSQSIEGFPDIATTEVYKLAQAILSVGNIKQKIDAELNRLY